VEYAPSLLDTEKVEGEGTLQRIFIDPGEFAIGVPR
jgi:hypothetical protein